LARKVPFNIAKQLLLFGEELSAQEAHRIGLVNKVVDGSQLTTEVTAWSDRLAQGATRGIAACQGNAQPGSRC
jgi:2-(1,2-epoxy-1,2-dihydrophenyl)acetyl-CoA isomerase